MKTEIPDYLSDRQDDWRNDPRATSLRWFQEAERGLFVHFSPASVLTGGVPEWITMDATYRNIHNRFGEFDNSEYDYWLETLFTDVAIDDAIRKVWDRFSPDRFDAGAIADLALAAGMKYVTFTTRHDMGRMFLFETRTSPCNSVNLSPHRDFVGELAEACAARRLGLFLYVMPPFDDKAGRIEQMLTELLTNYGPVAGIWFDGIARYYQRPEWFEDLSRIYQLIRTLQPGCLVSFKTGASGEEDFIAPEWPQCSLDDRGERQVGSSFRQLMEKHPPRTVTRYTADQGFYQRTESMTELWHDVLRHKPIELCGTLQEGNTWFNRDDVPHASLAKAINMCEHARALGGNLLLNAAPLGDGSIHPQDRDTLTQLGQQRREATATSKQPSGGIA